MHSIEGISVVVPVFNNTASLPELVSALSATLEPLPSPYEIILVNDASTDGSWAMIENFARTDARVRGLNLMRNYGQHCTLVIGLRDAKYSVAVTIDADGQHMPEDIPLLLEELKKGCDVVYGFPERSSHPGIRGAATVVTKWLITRLDLFPDLKKSSALRAIRTPLCTMYRPYPYTFLDSMLRASTNRISSVRVRHKARSLGRSSHSMRALFNFVMSIITTHSTQPVLLIECMGFLLVALGVLCLSAVFFACGIVTLSVGMIGEYVARTLLTVRYIEHEPVRTRTGESI